MLTSEQIERRKHHITGTDIARILNISPFGGPLTVWGEKLGLLPATEPNEAMERGTYLESGILDWYVAITGAKLRKPGTIIHRKYPLIAATPDAVAVFGLSEYRAVEAKAPTPWTQRQWGKDGSDDIPQHYIPQAIFVAAVTETARTDIPADIGTALRIYPVMYDEELFQIFREASEKFWRDYVETKIPPPAGPADVNTIKQLHPTARIKDYVEADEILSNTIDDYHRQIETLKHSEQDLDKIKAVLIQTIGDKSGIKGSFGRIDYKNNMPSSVIEWQLIARELNASQALIAKHTILKPGARPFKVFWKKESK